MITPRKKRSLNFSLYENRLLVDLVLDNIETIENKKSDTITWAEKKSTWSKIERIFNSKSVQCFRSAEALRLKYEAIKKDIRKKGANIKKAVTLSGGIDMNIPEYWDFEKKLLGIANTTAIEGAPIVADGDGSNLCGVSYNNDILVRPPVDPEYEEEEMDLPDTDHQHIEIAALPITSISPTPEVSMPMPKTDYTTAPVATSKSAGTIETNIIPTRAPKWYPKPSLARKTSTFHVRKKIAHNAYEKFAQLADTKKDLVQLQRDVLKTELAYKVEENKIKLEILREELNIKRQEKRNRQLQHEKEMELLELKLEEYAGGKNANEAV